MSSLTELERGRSEATHTTLRVPDVRPYLAPVPQTPFPLRYAFHLLGDVHEKRVLDLGCGSGEAVIPLLARGASVIAVDLSQDLIELARKRLALSRQSGNCRFIVASAYEVPLPNTSVDVILCSSLLHHMKIPVAMEEIRRLLKSDGIVVVKEPVRFSKTYAAIRSLFSERQDISEDEHPLTLTEFEQVTQGWMATGERAFRLPFIAILQRVVGEDHLDLAFAVDGWILKRLPVLDRFATIRVLKLQKDG